MNVFDFAMKIELQGKAYYENLAATAKVPGLAGVFLELSADEQKHYDVLRQMKEGVNAGMVDSVVLDRARSVFGDLLRTPEAVSDLKERLDVYGMALQVEAESVRIYEEMAKKEENPVLMQLLLTIANEEKKHYNIMQNVCDFVARPKYYLAWREPEDTDLG